jgi:hypothetical protein
MKHAALALPMTAWLRELFFALLALCIRAVALLV